MKKELDDLSKTRKNFEARVGLAKDLETMSAVCCISANCLAHNMLCRTYMGKKCIDAGILVLQGIGDYVDIREEVGNSDSIATKGIFSSFSSQILSFNPRVWEEENH